MMNVTHKPFKCISPVGTSVGDVGLWDVAHGKKLLSRNFRVWDIAACSEAFKVCLLS